MSFQRIARILLQSQAHVVSVRTTTIVLSSRQWQASQRVKKHWLSTLNKDNSSFRVALEQKSDDPPDATVAKDAHVVLEEIRNSIYRNVTRILTHQPTVRKDWERYLQQLEQTKYSSNIRPLWNTTTTTTSSQVEWSAPSSSGDGDGDALPWEPKSNAKWEEEEKALPWDTPVEDALHVANVNNHPHRSDVSIVSNNHVAFDATREEIATSNKDLVDALSPSPANTGVSTTIPNSEPEPCQDDESLRSTTSQVRVHNVVRANAIDSPSGISDDTTLLMDPSFQVDSPMSTNETNSHHREQPSLLELLRQPLEDEMLVMENVVATTPEEVRDTLWSSQPFSLLDLLNDDSEATASAVVDTPIIQNTFHAHVPSSSEPSKSWANRNGSDFGDDSIPAQRAAPPQSLVDLLRRPKEDESPPFGGENGLITSSAGEEPMVRVGKVSTATMPAFDFDDESSHTIPALGSLHLITDKDEDDYTAASEKWSDDVEEEEEEKKEEKPKTGETPIGNDSIPAQRAAPPQSLVELLRRPTEDESPSFGSENGQIASSAGEEPMVRVGGVSSAKMPAFDFDDESSDTIPALGSLCLITDKDEDDYTAASEKWSNDVKEEEKPKTGETPKAQFDNRDNTATMPSFDFGNDFNDAMPSLGSGEGTSHERGDNNSRLAPENWNNVSSTDDSWQTMPSSLVGDDMEYQTSSSALDQGLAILLAMKDRDWEQLEPVAELSEEDVSPEDVAIGIKLESDSESEESSDEGEDKLPSLDDNEDDASLLGDIGDLLEWTSFGEIVLSTADYNAMLLQLATSTLQTDEAIQMMVKTYRHMTEVGRSDATSAPDATTYTILMVALDRRANAPSSAAEICREMMTSGVTLSPEALVEGIRSFHRRNNVKDAECLFHSALDSESHETTVPVGAWLGLLQIYKHLDMQQEAFDLVKKCIQVNGAKDSRCVSKVITDTIYWPRRDFRGRRINSSQLMTKVLDLLESNSFCRQDGARIDTRDVDAIEGTELSDLNWVGPTDDDASAQSVQWRENEWKKPFCMPSYKAWRQLILSLSTAAEAEAGADWPIVHRAFTAMQSSLDAFCPDSLILKVGLRTAEMTRDADLASDLVIRAQDVEFEATHESHTDSLWLDNDNAVGYQESEFIVVDPPKAHFDSDLFGVKGSDDLPVSTDTSWKESVGSTDVFNAQEVVPLLDSDTTTPDNFTSSSYKPRHNSVRATPQAFASAIRLCVATGNMTSAEKLLDCLRDRRNTFPSSVKSDLFTLVVKGYAKVGDCDSALSLLKEMQDDGPKPTERAYGTVIHSLAVAKRTEEAGELFTSMDTGQFRDNVSPGLTCHDGRMLAYMEANAWEETLAFHSKMKEAGIPWSPLRFQGVLLASSRLGDRTKALEAIEGALGSGVKMDRNCCELSMRIILGDVLKTGNIDQARTKLRHIGTANHFLQPTSLNFSRALRAAEGEERRQPTDGLKLHEIVLRRDRAWNSALQHLVHFARAIEKEDSEVVSN